MSRVFLLQDVVKVGELSGQCSSIISGGTAEMSQAGGGDEMAALRVIDVVCNDAVAPYVISGTRCDSEVDVTAPLVMSGSRGDSELDGTSLK